jgi:uncharacterized membrane protein YhaH (DUF805 family)
VTAVTTGRTAAVSWYVARGRLRRSDWWLRYLLVFFVLGLVASWIDRTWFPATYLGVHGDGGRTILWPWFVPVHGGPATGLTGLVLLVPQVSAMVARLHDRDHSAWWLLWSLLPVVGWAVLVVTVCFLGPQPATNRYGPPPAGSGSSWP